MIARLWHGATAKGADADTYQKMLEAHILPGIHRVSGFRGASLMRRDVPDGVEFVTITYFEDLDAVKAFAGEDYTRAVIAPDAAPLLTRHDEHSTHYELIAFPDLSA